MIKIIKIKSRNLMSLTIILLLSSLISFGQTKNSKNCNCYVKTKSTSTKSKIVKDIKSQGNQNNISINVSQIVNIVKDSTKTVTTKNLQSKEFNTSKDTIIMVVKDTVVKKLLNNPEYELYGGIVNPKDVYMGLGYALGLNLTTKIYRDKAEMNNHPIITKLLYGFEFSQFSSKTQPYVIVNSYNDAPTKIKDCDGCEASAFGSNNSNTIIQNNIKHSVTGLSLNFGVGFYNNLFLLTGITDYKHSYVLNNETIGTYNKVFIDFGIKKYFKIGNYYLAPTFKMNQETTSFLLGIYF